MGRPSTETASDEKAISNPGYNDLNDDTYGNDNDLDNGVANDKVGFRSKSSFLKVFSAKKGTGNDGEQ